MKFNPALDVKQIPALMAKTSKIAPFGWWRHRLEAFAAQEAANPLLTDYFDEQFPIERAYGKVHDYHSVTGRYPNISRDNYDLFSFLGALALVDQHLPTNARRRLQSNIRGAL